MLQIARVTAFTISELLRENQQGGGLAKLASLQIRAKYHNFQISNCTISNGDSLLIFFLFLSSYSVLFIFACMYSFMLLAAIEAKLISSSEIVFF